ncbi:MAG: formate dehydrogenase subunit alpha, partial [Desulfobacterales bacterium]|nr:formate dehydrogenase subunit alpha [Desulfobacterales bacterium]
GSMSRRAKPLNDHVPEAYVEVNPADAEKLGIGDGQLCTLTSRRGEVHVRAEVSRRVPEGTVFMPFHFAEAAANRLTNTALDPIAKIPEFKVCAVKVMPCKQESEG